MYLNKRGLDSLARWEQLTLAGDRFPFDLYYREGPGDGVGKYEWHSLSETPDGYYVGQMYGGKRHGIGRLVMCHERNPNYIIEGQFENGNPNGQARVYYSDGGYYTGAMKDSRKHGYG